MYEFRKIRAFLFFIVAIGWLPEEKGDLGHGMQFTDVDTSDVPLSLSVFCC